VRGRLVAEFAGPVHSRHEAGAVGLMLWGQERAGGGPLELLFTGPEAVELPTIISDMDVYQLEPGRWRLRAHGGSWTLMARALLVHRDVGAAFLAAVPPPPLKLGVRVGWSLLLVLARVPGAVRLLQFLRSR
jgi:hypothetical protein